MKELDRDRWSQQLLQERERVRERQIEIMSGVSLKLSSIAQIIHCIVSVINMSSLNGLVQSCLPVVKLLMRVQLSHMGKPLILIDKYIVQ